MTIRPTAKEKSMMNSRQGGGGREKEHQTVWCCEVQFNNWTKAVDKLCQEKLHTPTHTTHTQFQLLKLAPNVSWHSGAWGKATPAPAHCWISVQYSPSPALVVPVSVTGEVSQRLPIKSVHYYVMHLSSTLRFCSPLACCPTVCTMAYHTLCCIVSHGSLYSVPQLFIKARLWCFHDRSSNSPEVCNTTINVLNGNQIFYEPAFTTILRLRLE